MQVRGLLPSALRHRPAAFGGPACPRSLAKAGWLDGAWPRRPTLALALWAQVMRLSLIHTTARSVSSTRATKSLVSRSTARQLRRGRSISTLRTLRGVFVDWISQNQVMTGFRSFRPALTFGGGNTAFDGDEAVGGGRVRVDPGVQALRGPGCSTRPGRRDDLDSGCMGAGEQPFDHPKDGRSALSKAWPIVTGRDVSGAKTKGARSRSFSGLWRLA